VNLLVNLLANPLAILLVILLANLLANLVVAASCDERSTRLPTCADAASWNRGR
jgi:hypothetical protein